MVSISSLCFLLLAWRTVPLTSASSVPCNDTSQCETLLREGSQCINNLCTNSFYNGGCLKNLIPGWNRTRICNSQDPPEAEALGYCRSSPMDYVEIRLGSGNWESVSINDYLIQILLSELMDVPTSIEGISPDVNINFYQQTSNFDFWNIIHDFNHPEIKTSSRVGDCRTVTTDPDNYEPCYHVYPEIWWQNIKEFAIPEIESLSDLGVLSELALYIPKFALDKDPSLVSFVGLGGEKNRRKVAETFKSPTRWGDYCKFVSPTNCTKSDPIATRAPEDDYEESAFFFAPDYNGHFRMTPEHDCDLNPDTCAGDFINAGCEWVSYARQQFYHNDIALEFRGPLVNGGYNYEEQFQIYAAANATREAVMILVFDTDPPYAEYLGTDAEMTKVSFSPPTQKCWDARITPTDTCNENVTFDQLYGAPEGACDTSPQPLKKMFSNGFRRITIGDDIPDEFKSPAYDALRLYQVSELSYREVYDIWRTRGTDPWGYDMRDATCQFFVDNLELFQTFVPESHPRVVVEAETSKSPGLMDAALAIAIIAFVLVLVSFVVAFIKRRTKVIYYTQKGFLNLVLAGMFLVAAGALLMAVPIANWSCAIAPWTINLGYVLQLVPLYCRISAISELATSGKQMERVRLDLTWLFIKVAIVSVLVGAFLLAWMIVDTPTKTFEYEMTNDVTPEAESIVRAYAYCGSENLNWMIPVFGWRALVIVPTCMIAMVASRVKEDLNDTKSISSALYTHVMSLFLQVISFLVLSQSASSDLMGYTSIILSMDTIVTLALYIFPKFLNSGEEFDDEPLPDVFVHTTIALLEVDGFTAWSSVREPVQVFQFLEQLYREFDRIAEKHGVYKVETVNEVYVVATGIPNPQSNHCVLMAQFAIDCMKKMPKLVKNMEVQFGPDTSDLTLRVGIASGPVTGGTLKSKGAKFQIFGDTVTTARLIQKHGMMNRIHLSQSAAEPLIHANKASWIKEREDRLHTPEKGTMKTYWLVKGFWREYDQYDHSCHDSVASNEAEDYGVFTRLDSKERWVEFNVEIFKEIIKQIIARRERGSSHHSASQQMSLEVQADMPLEEVKEVIELPGFDKRATRRQLDVDKAVIPDKVVHQLREYISIVAGYYNDNPFHNFAHASYVVMAIKKYMNRIIAASEIDLGHAEDHLRNSTAVQAALHSHTYGITSDPLTYFACVYSALIHDADHPGVPNPRLVQEDEEVAERFKGRSVAEQRSFQISWELLMEDRFADLLSTICSTPVELKRFRALVINSVMATDLGDKQLKELRNGRWEKAFAYDESTSVITTNTESVTSDIETGQESKKVQINRKATIVIEHLIQAADVAHMSQHWHIYRKWNFKLFREMYKAWREGRAEKNPADGWYKGEIGFFDFYIIPLSQKLRDCGVFGPTSDENYNYATNNRNMWVQEGEAIVKSMLAEVEKEYPPPETFPDEATVPPPSIDV